MSSPRATRNVLRQKGLEVLREDLGRLAPFLRDRVSELRDWNDVKLLTVAVDRLIDWSRPGLLCIGDAAHAMSPDRRRGYQSGDTGCGSGCEHPGPETAAGNGRRRYGAPGSAAQDVSHPGHAMAAADRAEQCHPACAGQHQAAIGSVAGEAAEPSPGYAAFRRGWSGWAFGPSSRL